jgi:sugar transferase (PEP-CTERM/EpsH1 system associated)
MLTPRFPYPPDRGDTVRSWGALEGLARGHEVWLACLDHRHPTPEHLEHVRQRCREVAVLVRSELRRRCRGVLGLLTGASLTEGYFADRRVARTLRRWSQTVRFDALITYSSSIGPLALDWLAAVSEGDAARRPGRLLLDMGDVDSVKWETYGRRRGAQSWSFAPPWLLRWLYRLEARRVAELETRVAQAHDLCLLVNERERRKLARRVPNIRTGVLPTAVQMDEYTGGPGLPSEPVVGMLGSMFYPPNVRAVNWFGRWVWPLVQREVPGARWLIVGSRPTRAVRRWQRCPGVTVTGYVPDVRPHLYSMRVFVNPVDGDLGVQSKLVVAMAAGRAAVVSPDAAAGICYDDPPPFLIARSAPAFADAVVRLLRDDAQARALGARARAVAAASYSAADQLQRIERWLSPEPAGQVRALPAAGQVDHSQPCLPAAVRRGGSCGPPAMRGVGR